MPRIPRHFHFIFGLRPQTEPFHIAHYLCLESCLRVNLPDRLTLYYHHEPYGHYWDLIKHKIELVRVSLNPYVANTHYTCQLIGEQLRYAHHADFIRVEKLHEHGGVYADMDTLFLRPLPDALFEKSFVLGRENPVTHQGTGQVEHSLCNALILSEPKAEFARIWLDRMPKALDGSWSNHSCQLAERIRVEHPGLIHVEPSHSFYPCMWTKGDLRALLEEHHDNLTGAYSVHLWAHLWWATDRNDFSTFNGARLTEDFIRKVNTSYNLAARPFLPPAGRLRWILSAWRHIIGSTPGGS
jgi:hypothetical protein